ncbi:hypothetical protein J3R30DRAFT_3466667 [Lentinula aciculospora]|uniref:RBR-type E3 ubiquitin transferase n=1 Tax=Lentinula aciculospora TaxID=153920 RepID=A0A9W9AG54_9AGAR|nr:hypothetical protein J3R30DRAFT_3466667 [Lentinula aciculospora]
MSTSPVSTRSRQSRNAGGRNGTHDTPTTESNVATVPALDTKFRSHSEQFQACPFFARGRCRYGDRCRWRHDATTMVATAVNLPSSAPVAASHPEVQSPGFSTQIPNATRAHTLPKPCFAWRKGSCAKGDQCRYAHNQREVPRSNLILRSTADMSSTPILQDPNPTRHKTGFSANQERACDRKRKANQDRERRQELAQLREAAAQRKKEEDLESKRREEEEALAREQLKLHQQALIAEQHRADALVTIQRIPLGSTVVTFGAGARIDCTVPGFETCRVTIRDIPFGVQIHHVRDFLQANLGDDIRESAKQKFHVVSLKRWNQSQEGVILADAEVATDLLLRLNGVTFRGQSLRLDLDESGGLGGMHTRNRGVVSLKISWRDPSSRYVVTYHSQITAEEQRRRFDGTIAFGRKIKVEHNTNRYGVINPGQVLISSLPTSATDDNVRCFFDGMTVRRLSSQALAYSEDDVRLQLKEHIQWHCSSRSITPPEFDEPRPQIHTTTDPVEHTIYVRFDKWDFAKQIHDLLEGQKFSSLGNVSFRLWLPNPIRYEIAVPFTQYEAQVTRWKSLLTDTEDKKDLRMCLKEKPEKEKVFIQVEGTDARAVGMLKVRVENLAAGDKLGLWHRSFCTESGRSFLRVLLNLTKALVVPDWRLKVVKAYGEPAAIEKARKAIMQEIDRLAGLEYTVTLNRDSVRIFAQHGIASLKERFGEDSVSLNISGSPRITIRGGEDAQHALHTLIEQSRNNKILPSGNEGNRSCPICLDEVSVPVQLGCGHDYCTACLHHLFTADVQTFPIVCLGDEVQCREPIALPIIQKFLTEVQFNALLETAFMHHVEKNPEVFKYCPTPDCEQLYRCADGDFPDHESNFCCPSCLSEICTRCHESHEGMSCDERRRARNDQENNEGLNARWAEMTGVKKCPKCSVWIEKTEGCNHISCRCGAHICWRCMGIFDADTIYPHMSTDHGGYGLGDGIIQNFDYDAQAREMRAWNNLANARRIAEDPHQPLYRIDPRRADRLREIAEEEQRENIQIELRRRQQEQRMRDLEATQRRTRQEEGGNWCTIM